MSLKKKFMSLIFTSDDSEEKEEVSKSESSSPEPEVPHSQPAVSVPPTTEGQEDKKIAESLAEAVAEANIEGFDYFEFAQLLNSLKSSMPSEQQLFQTAFTSAKVMKATKQTLIDTANHYLSILNQKNDEFQEAVQQQTNQTVVHLEEELSTVDQRIAEKAQEIQKLTDEINELTESKTSVGNQITENKAKIEVVRNNFNVTISKFVNRIKSDIDKINKYLTEGEV